MRIVICVKEVLDPDAVDNYVLHGKLEIGADGKTLTQTSIPRLMNAYDEQAIEAALRLRDAGLECTIDVVCVGKDPTAILRHAAAMGADEITTVPVDAATLDGYGVARILAAYVNSKGGADLILCGRQASDDDQGVVPALLAELLDLPVVTIARSVAVDGGNVTVVRVTPNGDEVVAASLPAVVTISNELGTPRYPTTMRTMKARRLAPGQASLDSLGLREADVAPLVVMTRQYVSSVQGNCQLIDGSSAAEQAAALIAKLRAERVL
jgi:electron transfer flavoprotein beta subunit